MEKKDKKTVIAMAPMEGITTQVYRKVYREYFKGVDLYYTPFLSLNQTHVFKKREKREYLPYQEDLIPQVLTNSVEDYIWGAKVLGASGYREININMGCPSGTVVAKKKGAGMLGDTEALRTFLEEVFEAKEKEGLPEISVKMRIGLEDKNEVLQLAKIFSEYPFSEIIVHPRLRKDLYNGTPDLWAFGVVCDAILKGHYSDKTKIMYNGDIDSPEALANFSEKYPKIDRIMLGRGLIKNPNLAEEISKAEEVSNIGEISKPKENSSAKENTKPEEITKTEEITRNSAQLYDFINSLYDGYEEEIGQEKSVLFKMKDILMYMYMDSEDKKAVKAIKKAKNREEIMNGVRNLL